MVHLNELKLLSGTPTSITSTVKDTLATPQFQWMITLNPELFMGCRSDETYRTLLTDAAVVIPESHGICWGIRRCLGQEVSPCPGVDLVSHWMQMGDLSCYLIGSSDTVIDQLSHVISTDYAHANLVGIHHGYLSDSDKTALIDDLRQVRPDLILVGMGFPHQEQFILSLRDQLDYGLAVGVGGSFDVLSGVKRRAPRWIRFLRLEWLYRGLREPKRLLSWGYLWHYIRWVRQHSKRSSI